MPRRPQKLSLYKHLWDRLSPEQQKKCRSIAWSGSVHVLLIAFLVVFTYSKEIRGPFIIEASFSGIELVDDFSLFSAEAPMTVPEFKINEIHTDSIETAELTPQVIEIQPIGIQSIGSRSAETGSSSSIHEVTEISNAESQLVQDVNRRVSAAGGQLEGPVRVSLMFNGADDIDLHVKYAPHFQGQAPRGPFVQSGYVWFGQPRTMHAALDVDANASSIMTNPCENVIFSSAPKKAHYSVYLHLFRQRSGAMRLPYVVTIHYGKKTKVFKGLLSLNDGYKPIYDFYYVP